MTAAIENKPEVARAVLRNISGDVYRSSDKLAERVSLIARPGDEIEVSAPKALQMTKDFPEKWSLVSAENEELQNQIAKNITEGLARVSIQKQQRILRSKTSLQADTGNTTFGRFLTAIKNGRVKVVTIDKSQLFIVIKSADYVGLNAYAHILKKPEEGEVGGSQKQNFRYILSDKTAKKPGKTDELPEIEEDVDDELNSDDRKLEGGKTNPVSEDDIPEIKPAGVERDVEGNVYDDLDDDLDKEDRHKSKRKARDLK